MTSEPDAFAELKVKEIKNGRVAVYFFFLGYDMHLASYGGPERQ